MRVQTFFFYITHKNVIYTRRRLKWVGMNLSDGFFCSIKWLEIFFKKSKFNLEILLRLNQENIDALRE